MPKPKTVTCYICKKIIPKHLKGDEWEHVQGPKGNKVPVCTSHPGIELVRPQK